MSLDLKIVKFDWTIKTRLDAFDWTIYFFLLIVHTCIK